MWKKRKKSYDLYDHVNPQRRSLWGQVWRNYRHSKGAMAGLVVFLLIIAIAIFAQYYYNYETDIIKQNIRERLQHPSSAHWFGTDQYGRDIFARILYGARYSLTVGISSTLISALLGGILGLIAGYYSGLVENVILRICEIFMGIPTILLGIAIMAAFGQSIGAMIVGIALVYVPQFARVSRAAVLPVRGEEYIEAARASGISDFQIIFTHILPNSLSPIIVQFTMGVAGAILTVSSLSFLGMGVPQPAPEWGSMLSSGRDFIRDYSYMTMFPGLAIMLTVLSLNLVGDGLRDALDPKLKR